MSAGSQPFMDVKVRLNFETGEILLLHPENPEIEKWIQDRLHHPTDNLAELRLNLSTAIILLKAWQRSQWTDFISGEKTSPLRHNTQKFIESVEER